MFDIKHMAVKERLLRDPKLILQNALDVTRAAEAGKQQVGAMKSEVVRVAFSSEPNFIFTWNL